MSASHEWSLWHLTPRGWEQGDWKIDFGSVRKKKFPPDRVVTCRYHERMSSVFSQIYKYVDEEWRSEDEVAVAGLLEKHGECPETL